MPYAAEMKISHVARALASGTVLYIAMAACGAAESGHAPPLADAADSSLDAVAAADAFADALVHPVKDAKADPLPPLTFDEPCDKDISVAGTMTKGAVHDFPGKTPAEISAVRVLVPTGGTAITYGAKTFERSTGGTLFVTAGSAVVLCGTALAGQSVTFIFPQ